MMEPEPHVIVGQIWSLRRCSSSAAVQKVETLDGELIVHVSILGSNGEVELGHAPFAHQAFLRSVDSLQAISRDNDADFWEGYSYWRSEYDRGAAGVFSVDVCDV